MRKNSLVKVQTQNDAFFIMFISLLWTKNMLLAYIRALLMQLPYIWKHVDMILTVVVLLSLLLSLPILLRRIYVKDIMLLVGMYLVYYLYYLLFPDNRYYYDMYGDKVLKEVIPMFLVGVLFNSREDQRLHRWIYRLSVISIYAFCVYTLVFRVANSYILRGGDMHSAYLLLPHICISYGGIMRKAGAANIIAFTIGSIMLLFLGTRGALLCLGVFVICATLCSDRLKRPGLFLAGGVFLLLVLFAFGLLDFLYELAEKLGLSLRIFEKLENGVILENSGRDSISDRIKEYIALHPMLGMGIFSDRQVAAGNYAHNLILESLIHFGIVGSIPFLGGIGFLLCRAFRYLRSAGKNLELMLLLALFCSTVVKLFLSSSYIVEPKFFLLLGYARAVCREGLIESQQNKALQPMMKLLRSRR